MKQAIIKKRNREEEKEKKPNETRCEKCCRKRDFGITFFTKVKKCYKTYPIRCVGYYDFGSLMEMNGT